MSFMCNAQQQHRRHQGSPAQTAAQELLCVCARAQGGYLFVGAIPHGVLLWSRLSQPVRCGGFIDNRNCLMSLRHIFRLDLFCGMVFATMPFGCCASLSQPTSAFHSTQLVESRFALISTVISLLGRCSDTKCMRQPTKLRAYGER